MSGYTLHDYAKADLVDIWNYVARRNPAAANRLLDELYETFDTIVEFQEIGRRRDDLMHGLRCLVYGDYLIFYLPDVKPVEITRVVHGAKDLKSIEFE